MVFFFIKHRARLVIDVRTVYKNTTTYIPSKVHGIEIATFCHNRMSVKMKENDRCLGGFPDDQDFSDARKNISFPNIRSKA